jgi:hypothetical protein
MEDGITLGYCKDAPASDGTCGCVGEEDNLLSPQR